MREFLQLVGDLIGAVCLFVMLFGMLVMAGAFA